MDMTISKSVVIALMVAGAYGQACRPASDRPIDSPRQQLPLPDPTPGFTVIEEERFYVIAVQDAPLTPRERLLAITEQVHRDGGAKGETSIAFRNPTYRLRDGRIGRSQQWVAAFAMGIVDKAGVSSVRMGPFN